MLNKTLLFLCFLFAASNLSAESIKVLTAPNGIAIPDGYKNWRLIAVSQRTESQTLRAVLGNSIAVDAARGGKTRPWPEGSILVKLNWKQKTSDTFATAIVPDTFIHADFMIKDNEKYAATGGWGYARWLGSEQKPYGKDASFSQECLACHGTQQANDYVFTIPVQIP